MQPLRIDFTFSSPLILPGYPIHLDALAAWAAVEQSSADGNSFEVALKAQERLPFERWTQGSQTGYKASCLYFTGPATAPQMVAMTTKPAIDTFADMRRSGGLKKTVKEKFSQGTGQYKLFNLSVPARYFEGASAWCIGDPEKLRGLLDDITCVGKLSRNGFGRVKACAIVEDETANSKWRRRNLPTDAETDPGESYLPVPGAVFPPYWKKDTFTMVQAPAGWY